MWSLDNFIKANKETEEVNGNEVLTENATNLIGSNETVLREANTTKYILNRMRQRQAAFSPMWREGCNWIILWHLEWSKNNLSRGNPRKKIIDGLTKWLKVGPVTDAPKVTRQSDAWKVIIAYAKGHGTWLIEQL